MASTPKTDGLTGIGAVRKPVIVKPEHIKRGILILLGLAAFLTIAAVIKGISQSHDFKAKQEQSRTKRQLEQDKVAEANAKTPNKASTFQQDVATYQRTSAPAETTSTTSTTTTTADANGDRPTPAMLDAVNEERLRAYRDIRAPLAIAIPDGNKPAGSTSAGNSTTVTRSETTTAARPGPEAAPPQAAPVDPEMEALLQKRGELVEQLRMLEAQNGPKPK